MKRYVLAAAMTSLLAGTALAADMPARMPTKAVPYVNAMYNWTGAYVGLNAGYGWARASDSLGASANLNGFVGGAQIGYNWQAAGSPLVLGLEADFQGAGQSATQAIPGVTLEERLRWFGTIRGRVGYAWDRTMLYFTGGFAYVNTSVTLTTAAGSSSDSGTKGGYALGGGIEHAFAGPWSAGLEYLYVDTGSRTVAVGAISDSIKIRENLVRAKLNYRF